jgi:GT2 family glycosyltransferase
MSQPDTTSTLRVIGLVAIGRNEGDRLRRCLESVRGRVAQAVYVDSGSTDGSVEMAQSMGVDVVVLDTRARFTAARARNAGFERLASIAPTVEFVQFVDGDCQVVDGWIERAAAELAADAQLAVVCGRRREQHPEASIYNRLCDLEWNTPVGPAKACGGDAMIRSAAFREVGGYDPNVIAGEEPEMCLRLRQRNWTIRRIVADMTLHDAAMTRFGQWWTRTLRAGHAAAEGAAMHGAPPERHKVRDVRSNWFWGLLLPLVALGLAWPTRGGSLLLLPIACAYLWWRIVGAMRISRELSARDARLYATFCVIGKLPSAIGQAKYWTMRILGRRSRLIEYKSASPSPQRANSG